MSQSASEMSDARCWPMDDVSAIVLVGGRSRRLGTDKAMLRLDGITNVERLVRTLRALTSHVVLVGGQERFGGIDARWIPDRIAGAGPLGGIISGLDAISTEWCFVLACDTPLVSAELLKRLYDARSGACDAVVPRHAERIEPLVGLYARRASRSLSRALESGERTLHRVLERMSVNAVEESALREVDAELDSFVNLNTPVDVLRVRTRLAELTAGRGSERR